MLKVSAQRLKVHFSYSFEKHQFWVAFSPLVLHGILEKLTSIWPISPNFGDENFWYVPPGTLEKFTVKVAIIDYNTDKYCTMEPLLGRCKTSWKQTTTRNSLQAVVLTHSSGIYSHVAEPEKEHYHIWRVCLTGKKYGKNNMGFQWQSNDRPSWLHYHPLVWM